MATAKRARRLPWVIPEYCEGCTSCLAVCPKGLISMREHGGSLIPWVEDPDECTGCGKCADICGLGGIAMTEFADEARARFLARCVKPTQRRYTSCESLTVSAMCG